MAIFSISREHLSELILTNNYDMYKIKTYLKNTFADLKPNDLEKVIKEIQRCFLYQLKKKWQDSQRKTDRFKLKNRNWLNGVFIVQLKEVESEPQTESPTMKKVGRSQKPFEECCDRAKRYKAGYLRENFPIQQLNLAVKNLSDTHTTQKYIDNNEALAMITNASLSKYQYEVIRETLKKKRFQYFASL